MPIVYILTLFLLLISVRPQCTPSLYSLNLTTDLISFSSINLQNNWFSFTFRSSFSSIPQVALAITHITTNNQPPINDSQFSVYVQGITSRGVQILMNSQGSGWSVSRICLMASTNSQLLVGSVSLENSKPMFGTTSPNLQFQIPIVSALPVNTNQIARGFLNGLAWNGGLNTSTLISTVYSAGKVTVNLNAQIQNGQINVVWVSYVVFNLNNVEFSAYGGYVSISSGPSQTLDLIKGFSVAQNSFYGINALQIDPKTSSPITLQTFIDSNFLLSYASQSANFMLSYLFIGYPANTTCSSCKIYGMGYWFNGSCVSACSTNTVPVSLPNGGQMCRGCPQGTGLIAVNGNCVCPNSSILQDGKCTQTQSSLQGLKVSYINPSSSSLQNSSQQSQIQYQYTSQNQAIVSCSVLNSFYNGNECVCMVGFIYSNGKCILPSTDNIITPPTPTPNKTCSSNSFFNGTACVCNNGYYLFNNNCIQCPQNSQWTGSTCVCNLGFTLNNGICVQRINCPAYSQDNGLGTCICISGYTMVNSVCQQAITCPPNSTLIGQSCTCNSGFFNISGACSQCPSGALWSSQTQKCIYVCGVNSLYNQTAAKCVCNPGFGRDSSGTCSICGNNYFLQNEYCVTCPVSSVYDQRRQQCVCPTGYMITQQGNCAKKCGTNQVYNTINSFCDCLPNFERVGTVCTPCPTNSYYSNGQCSSCPPNSYLLNKKCVCTAGYAADSYGVCQPCSSLSNSFMLNGYCVKCSGNQIYNASLGVCQCPFGKTMSSGMCVSSCNLDEILDSSGNCFTCGMNQVLTQGVCICRQGFVRNSCGACILNCPNGSFTFMGSCGTCPMNMNYLPSIGGCVCPNNYYMDPILNICVISPFVQPNCSVGSFYDSNNQKCISCASTCATCTSLIICTSCVRGFSLNSNTCVAVCGDGIITGGEGCDSGASLQPGCRNCQIVSGYICSGQPSVCYQNQTTPNNTTPNNTVPTAKLSLKGNISLNSNNIFLTLITTPTFTFPNENVMQSFIQSSFVNTIRPTTYCIQQSSPNLNCFDCLLIYPSGIPNTKFNALFWFNYQGQSANLTITIDPLLYANPARTTQPVPTRPTQ